jgi:hypothetical protein
MKEEEYKDKYGRDLDKVAWGGRWVEELKEE